MKLTNADITQFQQLYTKHFHIELSKAEAREKLLLLVRQMQVVYRPITVKQFDELLRRVESDEG